MLSNLAQELFWQERVTTTVARAKLLRPYAEKLITKARSGSLHARRQILAQIEDTEVVTHLFDEVAPRYAERPGGYTRIVRVGPRRGDGAEMAIVELV
jgi:large subunit ribosomal protein L17